MVPLTKFSSCAAILLIALVGLPSFAADELKLRDGISFYQDVDAGFPIVGDHLDDLALDNSKPNIIFFGSSGDLNTNRQARRLVDAYRKYRTDPIKFIIVDVDKVKQPQATQLLKTYYKGYIPFEVIVDKTGTVAWSQVGEVDQKILEKAIDKSLP